MCSACDHQMYISCFSLRSTCTKSAGSFLWVSYLLRSPSHQRIFPALHRIKLNVPIPCIKRTRLHYCSCGNVDPSFSFFDKPVGYTSCRVNYLLKICYIKTLWVDRNTVYVGIPPMLFIKSLHLSVFINHFQSFLLFVHHRWCCCSWIKLPESYCWAQKTRKIRPINKIDHGGRHLGFDWLAEDWAWFQKVMGVLHFLKSRQDKQSTGKQSLFFLSLVF